MGIDKSCLPSGDCAKDIKKKKKKKKKEKKARESLVSDAGWYSNGNLSSNSLIPLPGRPLWQTSELNFRSYGIREILREDVGSSGNSISNHPKVGRQQHSLSLVRDNPLLHHSMYVYTDK